MKRSYLAGLLVASALTTTGCGLLTDIRIPPEGFDVEATGNAYDFSSCQKGLSFREGEEGFLLKHKLGSAYIVKNYDENGRFEDEVSVSQFYRTEENCNYDKDKIDFWIDFFQDPADGTPKSIWVNLRGRVYTPNWDIHNAHSIKLEK